MPPDGRREPPPPPGPARPPLVVDVDGESMSPSLELGWKVLVDTRPADIAPGDIVLLRRPSGLLLHRALGETKLRGRSVIGHVGDSPGARPGLAPLDDVIGRAVAVLAPRDAPWPSLDNLPRGRRRRFEHAQRSFRASARIRVALEALERLPPIEAFGGFLRRRGLVPSFGAPLVSLHASVSLRLVNPAPPAPAPEGIEVREIARIDVPEVFRRGGLPPPALDELDRAAGAPWRCFVALRGPSLLHHSFVAMRSGHPLLFRVVTLPPFRSAGVFGATAASISRVLAAEGEPVLYSSCSSQNRRSLRAHRAAGFLVERRRFDARIGGISVRAALARKQ